MIPTMIGRLSKVLLPVIWTELWLNYSITGRIGVNSDSTNFRGLVNMLDHFMGPIHQQLDKLTIISYNNKSMTSSSAAILKELSELKTTWRIQGFTLSQSQQQRYDELLQLRRAFVSYWKENGMVWIGPKIDKKDNQQQGNVTP